MSITAAWIQYFVIILTISCNNSIIENDAVDNHLPIKFNTPIDIAGNTWIYDNGHYSTYEIDQRLITDSGIRNWTEKNHKLHIYFYSKNKQPIRMGLKGKVGSKGSKLKINFEGQTKIIELSNLNNQEILIGQFEVKQEGYQLIEIEGLEKRGKEFADLDQILLSVQDIESIHYAKDDFYWSRRGPSVHLRHEIPESVKDIEWFYSEILVPEGEDVIGSYFMANGFNHGYFGIQVNSPTERRILFSVWSPFNTDNPNEIPEDQKIKLLKKGDGVTTGEFGNEGSGGQSYKVFNWKSNTQYGFLLGASPNEDNSTDYVAYFFDPGTEEWNLIAGFRRPKTNSYLLNLYSFLENFRTETGVLERYAEFGNQWIFDTSGWHEITEITFTADNTARKNNRLDYSGGVDGEVFILKNCGFSNERTEIGTKFRRSSLKKTPNIDFDELE